MSPSPPARLQPRVTFPAARMLHARAAPAGATRASPPHHRLEAVSRDHETIPERLAVVTGGNRGIGLEVNNAGVGGVVVDQDALRALNIDPDMWLSGKATHLLERVVVQTYDEAVKCLKTNYYGIKWVIEGLLPLLKRSTSGARIVNTTSLRSELKRMPNEKLREELRDADAWDEKRIEAMLEEFLEALKHGRVEEEGWPTMLPAYSMSKMVVNLYTRILARRHPEMRVNCVHPGFVKTEINWNTGVIPPEEGARGAVKLALLPHDGPTGCYFDQTELGVAW
ncbi:unnamed protein product [Urochloa decumbens]|uniref:Uncharacterized protein n=1 Tax=Urochloa decumbens TaxID=240449 RepID=A0ABC9EPZ6_9POAL